MISNMQHQQQFESVAMEQILPQSTTTSVVVDTYVNNNNNSKMNKNIHLMSSSDILPFQDSNVIIFEADDIFEINSSSPNTKEIVTVTTLPTIVAAATPTTTIIAPRNQSSTNCDAILATATSHIATTINNVVGDGYLTRRKYGIQQMPVVVDSSEAMIDGMMKEVISNDFRSHEYALSRTECDGKPIERSNQVASTTTNRICKMQDSVEETEKERRDREELERQQQQQSHSDALRCIEDVHNYSKSPKSQMDESTNSSSEEDEDDDDEEDDDVVGDDDEDMDDDVFHTSPKSSSVAATTISKGHVANKINVCDKSANKSTPREKKQSQQHQLQTNQISRHTKSSSYSSSDEMNGVSPTATTKSSPLASAITKLDITTKSSTSPQHNNILNTTTSRENATVTYSTVTAATAYDVPDVADIGENCDGTGGGGINSGDKLAPDHHARRPMNAFLIFCKRHRAIVRDKYKNLENRQITKILGEWWATLSNVEKACYTDLAKQYKDAFFKANPNFKWYKLPAPPLRTCTTRPDHSLSPTSPLALSNSAYSAHFMNDLNNGTADGHDGANNRYNCDNGYVRKSSFSFNYADIYSDSSSNVRNISNNSGSPLTPQKSASNAVGVFKLADEAQMGSLSMLCGHNGSSSSSNSPNSEFGGKLAPTNDNNVHDALQNALGDASNFLSATIRSCGTDSDPYQNMRDHAHRMENNQVLNGKRKSSDESINNWTPNKKPYSPTEGSERASRSCKGKRYQELMISGQIAPFGKKSNPKARVAATNHSSLNGFYKASADDMSDPRNHHHLTLSLPNSVQSHFAEHDKCEIIIPDRLHPENTPHANQAQHSQLLDSPNSQKQFDASDFDLEEKIKALPAQCLESYLTRKRETKKKKKIGSKRRPAPSSSSSTTTAAVSTKAKHHYQPSHHYLSPPKTIQEARERIQNAAVGSQKRKARKESITRRDVNTMHSATNSLLEAVGLVQLTTGDTTVKIEYDPENFENSSQLIDGMMTIIKEEDNSTTTRIDCNGSMDNNSTPTSDLLILAEVATFAKSHI